MLQTSAPTGKLPILDAAGEIELGGVLVLALTRMQIEIDPPEPLSDAVVVGIEVDVEHRDILDATEVRRRPRYR